MNGILDNQTFGNTWNISSKYMLHERPQTAPVTYVNYREQSVLRDLEAQMQDFEKDHQDALTEVKRHYILPSNASVLDFLNKHRALPQLLIVAIPQLRRYFADTLFSLRTTSDEDGWEILYADAMWAGDAREAIRLLDQFEDEWWIPNCGPARGALTFTYRLL